MSFIEELLETLYESYEDENIHELMEDTSHVMTPPTHGSLTSHLLRRTLNEAVSPFEYIKEAKKGGKKYWVASVKTKWHPPAGLFTKDAKTIATTIYRASKDLKQAVARVNFYYNRRGSCNPRSSHYSKEDCRKRDKVLSLLRKLFYKGMEKEMKRSRKKVELERALESGECLLELVE